MPLEYDVHCCGVLSLLLGSCGDGVLADCHRTCTDPRLQAPCMSVLISSAQGLHEAPCAHAHASYSVANNHKNHHTHHNNNNTFWTGSVLTDEEPPPHSGELNHALSQVGGPTQSQLSRHVSSGHHISMEHRLLKKHLQLNSETDASNGTYLKKQENGVTLKMGHS